MTSCIPMLASESPENTYCFTPHKHHFHDSAQGKQHFSWLFCYSIS
jgi:hypothetical protein